MRDELAELLQTLEREMRSQGRWDRHPPSDEALRSDQPFAIDTLSFDQWLQWIFIPRLQQLLVTQRPLPRSCAVAPMAEEVYEGDDAGGTRITRIVGEIDLLLTRNGGDVN